MSIPGKIFKNLGDQATKKIFGALRKEKNQQAAPEPSDDPDKDAAIIIRNHVAWSMGMGLIPVLMADIFAVSALQLDMIRQLCKVYGVNYKETEGKAIISSLTGSALARVGAASVVKLIPGIGTVVGGLTVSSFAGASTYALGEVFKKHFSSGGTILDFDLSGLKNFYNSKFEKGKKIAKQVAKERDIVTTADPDLAEEQLEINISKPTLADLNPPSLSTEEIIDKIKELGRLRDEDILTEAEFSEMKRKLLDKI